MPSNIGLDKIKNMTLHEAIAATLREAGTPLSINEIANRLNKTGLYIRDDGKTIEKEQIRLRVRNYSKIFDNINEQVILTSDKKWKSLLTTYLYIADTLRSYFSRSDFQFMIAALLFFKRVYDMNKIDQGYRIQVPDHSENLFSYPTYEASEKLIHILDRFELSGRFSTVFSDCSQLLRRLDRQAQISIFEALEKFNTLEYSEEVFGPMFEYFLHDVSIEFANSTTPYTPKYLQKLMVTLLAPEPGKKLYDPVCGSGGLLVEALGVTQGRLYVKGTEINHRMAQFGYMNLITNGFFDVDLEPADFLTELYKPIKYDYIIGDLPLNVVYKPYTYDELFQKWGIHPSNSDKGYSASILFVLSKLADKGRAVITVSETLLFKGGREKEIRELLIQEDLLEAVISLPNGALKPYTDAKCSILILNRNKSVELQGKIRFIESVQTYSDSKSIDVNSDEIVSLYENKSQESAFNQFVEREKLAEDLNLSVSTYRTQSILAKEMLSSGKAVKLEEIVDIRSGVNPKREDYSPEAVIPVVKIENLSKDILDLYLNLETLDHKTTSQSQYKRALLSKDSILIARIGEQLKPTIFKPSEQFPEILLHNGLFALIPNKKGTTVDLEYLYYQLHTEFVLDQIQTSRMGSVMSSISIARLEQVIVPYVEIAIQKEFVASQKASIIAAERAKVEERIKALGYKEAIEQKESDIVKTLVHQLRPTLVSIDLQVKVFKRIVEKYDLTSKREFDSNVHEYDPELEGLIEKPDNSTLGELLARFETDTLHLNNVLTSVNKVMNFNLSLSDKIKTDILQFIQDFADQHQQKVLRNYTIEVKGEHATLLIHPPSFKDLLDQLIINAEKHGFSDKRTSKKRFKISFEIRKNQERSVAVIDYQNNGKPFLLTQKQYVEAFTKGQSSQGSGIGGNYISRIIKAHEGALKIEEGLVTGFRMTIEIPLYTGDKHE